MGYGKLRSAQGTLPLTWFKLRSPRRPRRRTRAFTKCRTRLLIYGIASAPLPAKPKAQTLTLAARLAEERKRQPVITTTVSVDRLTFSRKKTHVSPATLAGLDLLAKLGLTMMTGG